MEFTEEQLRAGAIFATAAIKTLRKRNKVNPKTGTPYLGVHVRWSKFNDKLRKAFPACDAIEFVKALEKAEVLATVPGRGGPTVYLWVDKPEGYRPQADENAIDEEIANQVALLDAEAILEAGRLEALARNGDSENLPNVS
jgi:hypothetical protein